jgi:hypothetical protein
MFAVAGTVMGVGIAFVPAAIVIFLGQGARALGGGHCSPESNLPERAGRLVSQRSTNGFLNALGRRPDPFQ